MLVDLTELSKVMSTVLPNHILRLMRPEDRASLGKGGMTADEAARKWQKGEERKMHQVFEADIRRRGWPYLHSRMDKAPTIRKGWPDFSVFNGPRAVCIEFKAEGGKLDQEQKECIAELTAAGVPVLVAYDLQSAIDFAVKNLTATDAERKDAR